MRRVAAPANGATSRSPPTATTRSPRIATAEAIENRSSTVTTLPLERMRSAGDDWARTIATAARPAARYSTTGTIGCLFIEQ
jgi:hypothetical protein